MPKFALAEDWPPFISEVLDEQAFKKEQAKAYKKKLQQDELLDKLGGLEGGQEQRKIFGAWKKFVPNITPREPQLRMMDWFIGGLREGQKAMALQSGTATGKTVMLGALTKMCQAEGVAKFAVLVLSNSYLKNQMLRQLGISVLEQRELDEEGIAEGFFVLSQEELREKKAEFYEGAVLFIDELHVMAAQDWGKQVLGREKQRWVGVSATLLGTAGLKVLEERYGAKTLNASQGREGRTDFDLDIKKMRKMQDKQLAEHVWEVVQELLKRKGLPVVVILQ